MKKIYAMGIAALGCISTFFMTEPSVIQAVEVDEQRVSVHDPSVFYDKGEYYIFGSHLAQAKSSDLRNWTQMFTKEYDNPSSILGDLDQNLKKVFEWAGHDDADTKNGGYSIWAPDVIWNAAYQWEDGTQGAYMYYFSSSSTWRRSVISFAVSKNVEGPYKFVDTVIYSGFTEKDATDGSDRNIQYEGTNIDELIKEGVIKEGFSEKWVRDNGTVYNNDYAPNAIDPNLIKEKNGTLWMSYGSWSGGIFLLQLDPATGKPYYPGVDSKTADGRTIDRYFGTHLLGGWHQSGEAPYILYDNQTDYYYLFITYGGLTRTGGYNMRLFRSKTIDGVYVDAKGNHPNYNSYTSEKINDAFGIKVMGNYDFSALNSAYMAPGHNSAFIDDKGDWYLVYHTRFNEGTEYHEVRVHRMVMTDEGWPVAVPFEYTGQEKLMDATTEMQLAGTYEFVNQGTNTSGTPIPEETIQLNSNQTVSGGINGNWEYTKISDTEYHLVITDNSGNRYVGQFYRQQDESTTHNDVLTFSVVGSNNTVLWGVKNYTDKEKTTESESTSSSDSIRSQESSEGSSTEISEENNGGVGSGDQITIAESSQSSEEKALIEEKSASSAKQRESTENQFTKKQVTSEKSLPKTGQKSTIKIVIIGVIICCASVGFYKYREYSK